MEAKTLAVRQAREREDASHAFLTLCDSGTGKACAHTAFALRPPTERLALCISRFSPASRFAPLCEFGYDG